MMYLSALIQPGRLGRFLSFVLPWAAAVTAICFSVGLYFALFASPADYQQGDTVRIMYVHVPASWFAMAVYALMGVMSASYLIFKLPVAGYISQASAPIGATFAFISLATGSIWGAPMWGTWWVWDARLTSMLILFIMYIGYILLSDSFEDKTRGMKASSMLAILGLINLPIIKFSVDWWHTLHQPSSILKMSGPAIHASMLVPLGWMAFGYAFLFLTVLCLRLKAVLYEIKSQTIQAKLAWERPEL